MADNEPSAPIQSDNAAGDPTPGNDGTPPDSKPEDGADNGNEPAAPAVADGGNEPPVPDDSGEDNDPKPADGEDGGNEPPADPNKPKEGSEPEDQSPDLKSMSRAERAQYFQNLDNATRKEVATTVDNTYQAQPVDELKQKYIDQGHSDFEASMLAREEQRDQEADISKARAERAELNATLAMEATEVLNSVDWLNPRNKETYDKASSDAATELYDRLCLTRDENTAELDAQGKPKPGTGQIVDATMTPKQFYGLLDKIHSSGTEGAQIAAQKAAERQMSSVAAPSSNSNKQVDKSFEQLTNAEKRENLRASGHLVT